jgi:hypothetical protein
LIYLAVQIRHNTQASQAQARQTLLDQWSGSNWDIFRDPEMVRVYAIGLVNWPDISASDKAMFDMGMGRYLANIQNGLLLRDSGMIDADTVDIVAAYMMLCVRSPGGAKWWAETVNALPETRAYIEERVARERETAAKLPELPDFWLELAGVEPPARG